MQPAKLGVYEIEAEIGRGGMGVVYRARPPAGPPVALKVESRDARAGGESGRLRFDREASAARSVKHENVVQLLDSGRQGNTAFHVFELVSGGTLAGRVARSGPLDGREVARLGAGIARGLAAIHAAGIVHRDLKPANVLVAPGGQPKIADLGLVRLTGADAGSLTRTGEIIGTPHFMAPEQAEGSKTVDARADLYALGGTLYFLLTGEPPFKGTSVALVKAHLFQPPPRPRTRVASVPLALDALVHRLLAKEPALRGESAASVARELDAIAAGRRAGQASRSRAVAALLLLLVLGAGTAVVLRARSGAPPPPPPRRSEPPPAPPPPPPPASPPARDPDRVESGQKEITSLAFSGDGKLLASGGSDGSVVVWDAKTRTQVTRFLARSRRAVRAVALSAAGDRVAWAEAGGSVRCGTIATGAETEIGHHGKGLEHPGADATAVAFTSLDREGVISCGLDHYIKLLALGPAARTVINNPEWSDPVTAVAAVGSVVVYGTDTGRAGTMPAAEVLPFTTLRHHREIVSVAVTEDGRLAVTGSADGVVNLWDVTRHDELERQPPFGRADGLRALSLARRANLLLVAGERELTLWPVERGEKIPVAWPELRGVRSAAIDTDAKLVAVALAEGAIRFISR